LRLEILLIREQLPKAEEENVKFLAWANFSGPKEKLRWQ
jgi:hypothetical protein